MSGTEPPSYLCLGDLCSDLEQNNRRSSSVREDRLCARARACVCVVCTCCVCVCVCVRARVCVLYVHSVCCVVQMNIYMHICHWGHPFLRMLPLVEFRYIAFTRMPGVRFCRRFGSLL